MATKEAELNNYDHHVSLSKGIHVKFSRKVIAQEMPVDEQSSTAASSNV